MNSESDNPLSLYDQDSHSEVTALSAALSSIPHLGGPLATILSGAWTARRETRLKEAFARVASLMRYIDRDKVDWDYINSEEFGSLVMFCLERIATEHRQDRRTQYANLLTNSALCDSPSAKTQAEWFAESLSRMSPYHILAFRAAQLSDPDLKQMLNQLKSLPGAWQAVLACLGDLRSAGYVEFDIRLPVPAIIENLTELFSCARLTEIGSLFVAWIAEPLLTTRSDAGPDHGNVNNRST